jgi:hypothetical protein
MLDQEEWQYLKKPGGPHAKAITNCMCEIHLANYKLRFSLSQFNQVPPHRQSDAWCHPSRCPDLHRVLPRHVMGHRPRPGNVLRLLQARGATPAELGRDRA